MEQCIFCRIVSGDIPAALLVQTERVISFLDIRPVNPGHALVVPRAHVPSLLELEAEDARAAAGVIQRVAAAVCAAVGTTAFSVLQNNGAVAGQVIGHVHWHVIPRKPDDGFALGWRQLTYGEGELAALQDAIRERLVG